MKNIKSKDIFYTSWLSVITFMLIMLLIGQSTGLSNLDDTIANQDSMKVNQKEMLKNQDTLKVSAVDSALLRINKKLNIEFSKDKIEEIITAIILETDKDNFKKMGKNIYITNSERNIRLTINSYTNRIITADKLDKISTK